MRPDCLPAQGHLDCGRVAGRCALGRNSARRPAYNDWVDWLMVCNTFTAIRAADFAMVVYDSLHSLPHSQH